MDGASSVLAAEGFDPLRRCAGYLPIGFDLLPGLTLPSPCIPRLFFEAARICSRRALSELFVFLWVCAPIFITSPR